MSKKKKRVLPEELNLPPGGIDSHAHLDLKHFASDLHEVLSRAEKCGLSCIGNVFLGPDAYLKNKYPFSNFEQTLEPLSPLSLFFILGTHPHDAKDFDQDILNKTEEIIKQDNKIKAIGEIGLDFYYDFSPRDAQVKVFQEQLILARENDLPVVIHSREAEQETIDILIDLGFKDKKVLWHCFGKGKDMAKELLAMGWTLSIPGTVTYRKNHPLQEAVQSIPLTSMVLETDCPFLTPEPYRGKRNEPAFIVFTAQKIAELKKIDIKKVWEETSKTGKLFFNLI